MRKLSQIWFDVQGVLFQFIEKQIEEPLTEKLKHLVTTLELIRIEDMVIQPVNPYIIKLHSIPAQIADPMTPEELQAMACISRKLVGSSLRPTR